MRPDYHRSIDRVLGSGISALAVSAVVDEDGSLASWLDLSGAAGRDIAHFRFAIEAERNYADGVLGFADPAQPHPQLPHNVSLTHLAALLDVNRVLCVVALTTFGEVIGCRDYDDIDLICVEATLEAFGKFGDSLPEASCIPMSMN